MEILTHVQPVVPGIFTLPPYDQEPPRLLGGFCPVCKCYYFPRPRYCRSCLGETREIPLASDGIIYSFTVVRRKAPLGLPEPYGVGYIDLSQTGLRIFCLLDPAAVDQLRVGMTVRLAVGLLGVNSSGAPCLRPYFTPWVTR